MRRSGPGIGRGPERLDAGPDAAGVRKSKAEGCTAAAAKVNPKKISKKNLPGLLTFGIYLYIFVYTMVIMPWNIYGVNKMTKKVMVDCCAICTNGYTWRGSKVEVSTTSKMNIADIYIQYKEYIKANGNGAKLKEIHFVFDEGV